MRRARTYKLFRETKSKTISVTTSLILLASSLGGALPFLISSVTSADTLTVCASGCVYTSIQSAINAASTGDTVSVAAGTYTENVNVNKTISLTGAGAANTTIVATDGNATPLQFSANDATVSGFTITHHYTSAELSAWNFNNNGVIFNQTRTGNTLKDSTVTLSRNGVYINTARNNSLVGDTITNNRTGVNLTGDFTGTTLTGNTISNNWTEGLVAYGTNTPGIDLSSVTLSGNTFDSNWYEQVLVKSPSHATTSTLTGTLNLNGNSFTDSPVTYTTSDDTAWDEPGFAAEIPASLGGTATKPPVALPTLRIYGTPAATLEYSPKTLLVGATEPYKTIPDAITDASAGDTIKVDNGTYAMTTAITINKQLDIEGQAGATIDTSGSNQIFTFTAAGSTLNGFSITKTDNADQNIVGIQANNVTISNNTFNGQYSLAANAGTTRAIVVSTSTGSTISGNTITNLRQPAYVNDNATGQINNNHTDDTRGWVMVADSNFSFNGNTWGTNATDIAIIDNDANPATPVTNSYTCSVMQTIRANNNNAVIDNQVLATPCPLLAPTNLLPADGSFTNNPAFENSWSTVTGATKYEYRVSNTNGDVDTSGQLTHALGLSDDLTYSVTNSRFNNSGTPEGTYWWQVRAIAADGTLGAWSMVSKVTYDHTAPAVPKNLSMKETASGTNIPSGSTTTQANVTASWENGGSEPVTYLYESWYDNGSPYNQANPWVSTTSATSYAGAFNQGSGLAHFCVIAVDQAGNQSACSAPFNVTYDGTVLVAPTLIAPVNGVPVNGTVLTNSWSPVSGATQYEYESFNDAGATSVRFDGNFTTTSKTATNVADGTIFYWQVRAIDQYGTAGPWSARWKVSVDNTAPSATFTFPAPGPTATSFQVNFSEAVNATDAKNPANYRLNNWIGATSFASLAGHAIVSYNTTTHVATVTFTDPAWYVSAEQQWGVQNIHDLAGNDISPDPTTALSSPLVNPTAPGAPTTTSPTNATNVVWSWAAATDPGAANASGVKGYEYSLTAPSDTPTTWAFTTGTTATTSMTADGDYSLHVYTIDNAGNVSPEVTGNVIVDTQAPVVTVDTLSTTDTTPTVTGTVNDSTATVSVVVNGHTYTATVTGNTWSAPVSDALAVDIYNVVARATDAAGNTGTDSTTNELTVTAPAPTSSNANATPPVVPSAKPAAAAGSTGSTGTSTTANANPSVLGASTDNSGNQGQVKGDSTVKVQNTAVKQDGKFLGLGWWWILIVVAALGFLWFILGRRSDSDEKA